MDDHRPERLKVWVPLLFSLILIAGMVLGFNLRDTLRQKRDIQTVIERNDRLEQIIDLVNERYVDSINKNLLYKDAVQGIISHLDPHTVYIPAEELQDVNNDLEGSFFGIGVEFSIIRDTIQVTSVVEGAPSDQAGVEVGDQLIKVGDSIVAGKNITSERIVGMLKGKQYSRVYVTLRQPITGRIKNVSIRRDIIPLYSVEANIMLDSMTGLIKIDRFSATTYDEFVKAIQSLKKQGMRQLVLDLRQNPGGYLEAATKIADEFLSGDKLIVYTKGKRSTKAEYRAGKPGIFEEGKLVVLVDENSASASEIVAGAVQDWDRGIVIGRRTFGKGLVQEQYDLDDGSALRLTIAKYYTPSGRSIQRSYKQGKEAYQDDILHRYTTGELTGNDTAFRQEDTMKYYTSEKRIVYGGGGIMPDVYVPYDTSRFTSQLLNILFSETTKNVIWDYFINNRAALEKYKTVQEYNRDFDVDVLVKRYNTAIKANQLYALNKLLSNRQYKAYFQLQLKAQLARILFRNNGYYSILLREDNSVKKALQTLYGQQYLALMNR
jgi:carboxyl-terminal processing protease